jgi:asparagine synthase (glutamine-hydrolysing)
MPADRTLFLHVHQLPPGAFLVYCDGATITHHYWRPVFGINPSGIEPEAVLGELRHATRIRLDADVEVATYLSGGLDSSAITALASEAQSIKSFGVSFTGASAYDESGHARLLAAAVNAHHFLVSVKAEELLNAIPDATYYSEGLAINSHLPAKFLLSRAVREQGLKVVLTGEGADELFGGYPHFQQDMYTDDEQSRVVLENPLLAGVMVASGASEEHKWRIWEHHLGYVPAFLKAKIGLGNRVSEYGDPGISYDYADMVEELISDAEPAHVVGCSRIDISAYLWIRWALGGYILKTLGDGTEMAHSIEGRTPFLDHKLFELATHARPEEKIYNGEEKWILKRALGGVLPTSIIRRRKHPFLAPPLLMALSGDRSIREQVIAILEDAAVSGPAFFDYRRLVEVVRHHQGRTVDEIQSLEPVLMLALTAYGVHRKFGMRL